MGMDPFIGEITLFAGNFAPRGWAFCRGQLLPISQYTALFSILGTTYGGDGRTNFALPDLRGRVAVGFGQGPGLPDVSQGEAGGIVGEAGGSRPHNNMQPYLGLNYIIALQGAYPSRD